ncbi:Protein DA1-like domain - like 2 [Theobroma cacao]|nr:Protein DA1-like domain - like 2 [Theobroma cacao]
MQMKYQPRKQNNHSSPVCRGRKNQSWGNHYVKYETSLSTSRKTEKTLNVSNGESFIQVRFLGRPAAHFVLEVGVCDCLPCCLPCPCNTDDSTAAATGVVREGSTCSTHGDCAGISCKSGFGFCADSICTCSIGNTRNMLKRIYDGVFKGLEGDSQRGHTVYNSQHDLLCNTQFDLRCDICGSSPRNERYVELGSGGWQVCHDCCSTAVNSAEKLKTLIGKVQALFRESKLVVGKDIPIFLVTADELGKFLNSHEISDAATIIPMRDMVIEAVEKWAVISIPNDASVVKPPRYEDVGEEVREGLCHMMAYKWLEFSKSDVEGCFCLTDEQSEYAKDFRTYLKQKMKGARYRVADIQRFMEAKHEADERGQAAPETIDGIDGFKNVMHAVDKYGLAYTLDFVAHKKTLPK